MKIITLTVYKKFFDAIVNGEKKIEYRDIKSYWSARLMSESFDYIRFVNGYGFKRPFCIVKKLWIKTNCSTNKYEIHLGRIVQCRKFVVL